MSINKINKILSRAVAVSVFASFVTLAGIGCGGGDSKGSSGSSGGGSTAGKVKNNEILGALPSLHANYDSGRDALKEKKKAGQEAAEKKNNAKLYTAAAEAYDKAYKELNEKHEAATKAEWVKLNGKAVPFTMSEKFKELKLDIAEAKISGDKQNISAKIVASDDIKVNSRNCNNYEYAYYKALAKDGTPVDRGSFLVMMCLDARNGLTFTKGQSMKSDGSEPVASGLNNLKQWGDFASIQFVTQEEWR
jgi:hypothetical protein